MGFTGTLWNWFNSYLHNRILCVSVNNCSTASNPRTSDHQSPAAATPSAAAAASPTAATTRSDFVRRFSVVLFSLAECPQGTSYRITPSKSAMVFDTRQHTKK